MKHQFLLQNKKAFFLLLICLFIILLFFPYLKIPEILILILLIFLFYPILIAGGVIYGFFTKDKNFSAVLGFILPFVLGVMTAISVIPIDSPPQYPDLYFAKILAFLPFLFIGFFGAIAGRLAASENSDKNKRYFHYLAAGLFLVLSICLLIHPTIFYPLASIFGM